VDNFIFELGVTDRQAKRLVFVGRFVLASLAQQKGR
jgi:hypothetical protein